MSLKLAADNSCQEGLRKSGNLEGWSARLARNRSLKKTGGILLGKEQRKPNRLINEKALISCNMHIILWIGIPGEKRLLKKQGTKINLFFSQLVILPATGVM
ncbi:MAG: hypothetical protein NHB15_17455 [Methanosarcina barkeri]|nr:hypothetical protein [Methanosarcina sp. ERenArc_MAG2]